MAVRRQMVSIMALAMATVVVFHSSFSASNSAAFTIATSAPSPRAVYSSTNLAGAPDMPHAVRFVAVQALPEPRPNDAMLPVELNRTSLYWGLLCILILSVLFS
eukprot:CAMPEP_0172712124 /NCGR_PEP_ID=MMETSP1074-20121228/60919_1 /TAXON_ID=2916 /ORGANISM="Ceratium fusus, Strain PA161109" /LENGTH=103 /DNA_ID=CAMNT_0013536009 /DNA_START=70 /DNA_END=377 /DNA_ORIENTATION=+